MSNYKPVGIKKLLSLREIYIAGLKIRLPLCVTPKQTFVPKTVIPNL